MKPVGDKRVFVRKHNDENEIARYKARLVAQGFHKDMRLIMTKRIHLCWILLRFDI